MTRKEKNEAHKRLYTSIYIIYTVIPTIHHQAHQSVIDFNINIIIFY